MWDNLTANIDRNQGNLLMDQAWNLILIDHSRAFTASMTMPFPMTKIDKEFYTKLKALDEATIKERLGKWLFDGPKPILKRRDKIIEHFDKLHRAVRRGSRVREVSRSMTDVNHRDTKNTEDAQRLDLAANATNGRRPQNKLSVRPPCLFVSLWLTSVIE